MPRKNRAFDYSKYQDWIDPAECTPYAQNAKIHDEKQIKNICNSIKRFGWQQDTVLTRDNVLVIGHGRRLAALELGCKMPFHYVDKLADELTDEDIRELRIADNQTNAETGLDFEVLSIETEDLTFEGFEFELTFKKDDLQLDESDLDDNSDPKTCVIVSINCGNTDNYAQIKERLQKLCDEIEGSMAVKMQ